jgi:hypothetical protein
MWASLVMRGREGDYFMLILSVFACFILANYSISPIFRHFNLVWKQRMPSLGTLDDCPIFVLKKLRYDLDI